MNEYLRWLGIVTTKFDVRDKTLKPTILFDSFDPLDSEIVDSVFTDPIQKAQCFKLTLVFDSYFNMQLLPLQAYKYFPAN